MQNNNPMTSSDNIPNSGFQWSATKIFFALIITALIGVGIGQLIKGESSNGVSKCFPTGAFNNSWVFDFGRENYKKHLLTEGLDIQVCPCHEGLVVATALPNINPLSNEERAKSKLKPDSDYPNGANVNIFYTSPFNGASITGKKVEIKNLNPQTNPLKVAIIDSGISENTNIAYSNTAATNGCDLWNFIEPNAQDVKDNIGHGDLIAQLITDGDLIYDNVDLMIYKIIDDEKGTLFEGLCAFYGAIKNGAQIINLSWGFQDFCHVDSHRLIREAFEYAESQNVVVVCAAGNDGDDNGHKGHWPSNAYDIKNDAGTRIFNNVISVGWSKQKATNLGWAMFENSNYSKDKVSHAMPGAYDGLLDLQGDLTLAKGTSFATAKFTQHLINKIGSGTCNLNNFSLSCISVDQNPNLSNPKVDIGYLTL